MLAILIAAALTLPGCQSLPNNDAGPQASWRSAAVGVPDVYADGIDDRCPCSRSWEGCYGLVSEGCLDRMTSRRKLPVVVFMHGCTGPDAATVKHFALLGYITVAPNSFAESRRTTACAAAGSDDQSTLHRRSGEARHAAERLGALPWVDRSKLVLAGFGEGGMTAALYGGDEFGARIVLGWSCNEGSDASEGLRGVPSHPARAVTRAQDPSKKAYPADCGPFLGKQPHSTSIVGRDVLQQATTWNALTSFLRAFSQ